MRRVLIAAMMVAAIGAHAQQSHGRWISSSDTDEMTDEVTDIAMTQHAGGEAMLAVFNADDLVLISTSVVSFDSRMHVRIDNRDVQTYEPIVDSTLAMVDDYNIDELRGAERILVRVSTVRGQATYEFSGDGIDEAFEAHGW